MLGVADSPASWYYVLGISIVAAGSVQALRPGGGLRLPLPNSGAAESEGADPSRAAATEKTSSDLGEPMSSAHAGTDSARPRAGAQSGSFRCEVCGYVITLSADDILPECPGCGAAAHTRDRVALYSATDDELVEATRNALDEPGRYLVFRYAGTVRSVPLRGNSMRIGRSLSADVRLDDPTVSRRHAVVAVDGDVVRILDDRSLNGVLVNGRRIESHELLDDDEIIVGRYRLRFIDLMQAAASPAGSERADAGPATQIIEHRAADGD